MPLRVEKEKLLESNKARVEGEVHKPLERELEARQNLHEHEQGPGLGSLLGKVV